MAAYFILFLTNAGGIATYFCQPETRWSLIRFHKMRCRLKLALFWDTNLYGLYVSTVGLKGLPLTAFLQITSKFFRLYEVIILLTVKRKFKAKIIKLALCQRISMCQERGVCDASWYQLEDYRVQTYLCTNALDLLPHSDSGQCSTTDTSLVSFTCPCKSDRDSAWQKRTANWCGEMCTLQNQLCLHSVCLVISLLLSYHR